MKKLFMILVLLLSLTATTQAQERFVKEYNYIIYVTEYGEKKTAMTYTKIVFNGIKSDLQLIVEGKTFMYANQASEVKRRNFDDGEGYQIVDVKDVNTGIVYRFLFSDSGDAAFKSGNSLLILTNK